MFRRFRHRKTPTSEDTQASSRIARLLGNRHVSSERIVNVSNPGLFISFRPGKRCIWSFQCVPPVKAERDASKRRIGRPGPPWRKQAS